ncbi:MAG TPA: permease-like cell division protein FtsX [Mycobacteriales bacterium]|nr:permease-like cell division protein FtsX [Mycobacteriales bacterium]
MRASFVAQEVSIGLRRNLTLTVAAIVTTAVSLALLGAGLLVRQQANLINRLYYGKLQVAIFLTDDVSQSQIDGLRDKLGQDPLVKQVAFESKDEAYQKFKRENSQNSDLLNTITANDLPESFRVQLKDPKQFDVIRSAYLREPGVFEIQDYRAILDPIFKLLSGIKRVSYVVALIQVFASGLLIYNTVRVSAFGRRRETGIMRLVGASSFSIQLPFLVEGAVAGLVGGVIACVVLILGKVFVVDGIIAKSISPGVLPPLAWGDFEQTMPLLVLLGILVSGLASFLTLRRFVRV